MNNTKPIEPVFHPNASIKAITLEYGIFMEDLPCSIEWCTGHMTMEADTWDELVHQAPCVDLLPTVSDVEANMIPLLGSEGIGFNIYFGIERNMSSDQALAFAASLRNSADLLERAVRRHPELMKAAQIGGAS